MRLLTSILNKVKLIAFLIARVLSAVFVVSINTTLGLFNSVHQVTGAPVVVPLVPSTIQSVIVAPNAAAAGAGTGQSTKFRCRDYDEKGFCMRGDLCPYDHGNDPVVLEDVELSSMLNYNRPPPGPVVVGVPPAPGAAPGGAPLPTVGPPHLRGPPPSLPPGTAL